MRLRQRFLHRQCSHQPSADLSLHQLLGVLIGEFVDVRLGDVVPLLAASLGRVPKFEEITAHGTDRGLEVRRHGGPFSPACCPGGQAGLGVCVASDTKTSGTDFTGSTEAQEFTDGMCPA